jgi:glycosyltransferase involved in cell wall biosynthesis
MPNMNPLPFRDALHDDDGVASTLVYEGSVSCNPVVTIAIPTFNRPELIRETLASALAQSVHRSLEIVIVDNASNPANVAALAAHLDTLGSVPVRYFVNDANIGMFGNWNRCITLARGRWVTILSDDDLLLPDHLRTIFTHVEDDDDRTAYSCGATFLDQREQKTGHPLITALAFRLKKLFRFTGRRSVALTPRRLFWSNIAGSSLGAVFPRALAVKIGGYYPEDYPSADYFFHVRTALCGRLRQISDDLALIRLQVNESMKPATLLGFIAANLRMRQGLIASKAVPAGWVRYLPVLVSYERRALARLWGVSLTRLEVEQTTGIVERACPSSIVWVRKALDGGV